MVSQLLQASAYKFNNVWYHYNISKIVVIELDWKQSARQIALSRLSAVMLPSPVVPFPLLVVGFVVLPR